jgi:hypothetical protein
VVVSTRSAFVAVVVVLVGCGPRVSAEIVVPEEPVSRPAPTVVESPGAELTPPGKASSGGGSGGGSADAGLIAELDAIDAKGGSGAWDEEVSPILVARYDGDGSGRIDRPAEVRAISCEVYVALDDAVQRGYGNGIAVVYGFAPDYIWVGDAIGFDEGVRPLIAGAMDECGLYMGA